MEYLIFRGHPRVLRQYTLMGLVMYIKAPQSEDIDLSE